MKRYVEATSRVLFVREDIASLKNLLLVTFHILGKKNFGKLTCVVRAQMK